MNILGESIRVYRNELKYYINKAEYLKLSTIFNSVLQRDFYGSEDGDYWIRSLYFDTVNNDDYYDKVIGVKDRKKIRIRIYNTDTETTKLEIKNRYDQYMLKETVSISREDTKSIINGDLDVLLKYNNKTANKVYYIMHNNFYKPSIIVDYYREAYTCPINSIRITFDKNVQASKNVDGIFDKNNIMTNIFNEPKVILEIKYNNMLPKWIREILSTYDGDRSSVSKYCLGRELLG